LKPVERGNYTAIVEFENQAGFPAVHSSRAHEEADAKVTPLIRQQPPPQVLRRDRDGRPRGSVLPRNRAVPARGLRVDGDGVYRIRKVWDRLNCHADRPANVGAGHAGLKHSRPKAGISKGKQKGDRP